MPANSISVKTGLQVNRNGLTQLKATVGRRLRDFKPIGKPSVAAIRKSVANEFSGRYWLMPEGGRRAWAPVVPFGNKPHHAPLVDSGAYFNALMGRGPGAIERVSARRMEVGADSGRFPYAKYIRGGAGANISLQPLIIRPRRRAKGGRYAMFNFIGLRFGVWLRAETLERGLKLPPRPHLTRNPALTKELVRIAQRYVSTGKAA